MGRFNKENDKARVLPFRRAGRAGFWRSGQAPRHPAIQETPVDGLERYERPGSAEDDFRHRMLINAAGLAICVLLGAAGVWMAINLADLRRDQDCVLAGRKNCAGLSIPSGTRLVGEEQAAPKNIPPK